MQEKGSAKKFGELVVETTKLTKEDVNKGLKQQSDQTVKKTEAQIKTSTRKTIRNAVDHGIESPSQRKKMGKPIEGTVEISAYHDKFFFYLTISDDGKGEMVNIRESLFPMIRLHRLFDIKPDTEDPSESLVVAVENNGVSSCLLVDHTVSQQQVVLKDLGEKFKSVETVAGGAIMGDGRVGLVLNVEKIMEYGNNLKQ